MAFSSFAITFTFLMNLQGTRLSLLSRFRNPNEYVAPAEMVFPEDMSDKVYKDLVEEVPDLLYERRNKVQSPVHRMNQTEMPYLIYLKTQDPDIVEPYYPQDDDKPEEELLRSIPEVISEATITESTTEATKTMTTNATTVITPRRPPWYTGPHMATCYTCGLNASFIPRSDICHEAFESDDFNIRSMARYFRTKCYRNDEYWAQRIEDFWFRGRHFKFDLGLKRGLYGPYMGGCFKRFMDVGTVYTQRGCRTWWPEYRHFKTFASHRYTRLEALLKHEKNACVVSPHASLTPFSRGISLFVRYHVCVCEGKYCNTAGNSFHDNIFLIILIYVVV
ncbi:uncharacterized protein LOC115444186 [Manduca sexta]|uniref:Uncharacterized protein n=1 Tax=Manduca sexta TaxID=7130 RepID=A0A921Z4H1_MANSE|nr:uncharacterized protein LOC115444186 [Manduca sexta]KAG6451141.1 hypothetical protein O3G_MSEX006962 [Manduca sexta]